MEEIKKLRIDANHKQGADADALFSQAYEKLGSLASSAKGEELGDVLSEWADTLAVEFEQSSNKQALFETTNKKYEEAHKASATKHVVLFKWGNFLLNKGLAEKKAGKNSEADESLTQARNKYDLALELKHDYQEALSNLAQSLNAQGELKDGHNRYWFITQAAEKEKLLANLKAGVPIPETPSAPTPEGKLKIASADKDKGNECFKQGDLTGALRNWYNAINALNGAYGFSTQQEQTVKDLKIAIYNNMTTVLLKQNKFDRAIVQANQVLALDSQNVKALFRRGKAYLGNNDVEKARNDLLTAKNITPDDKDIKNELIALDKKEKAQDAKQKQFYSKMF